MYSVAKIMEECMEGFSHRWYKTAANSLSWCWDYDNSRNFSGDHLHKYGDNQITEQTVDRCPL